MIGRSLLETQPIKRQPVTGQIIFAKLIWPQETESSPEVNDWIALSRPAGSRIELTNERRTKGAK